WQKVDHVLTTYGFDSLGEFLSVLFHPRKRGEKDRRTKSHRQTVAAFLKGQSKITMAHIIPLIYNHHRSRPKRDTDQHSAAFSSSIPLSEIRYACPCLSAWATRLVGDRIYYGVGKLARHNRTDARNPTTNKRVNNTDAIEWEDVAFSVEELAALYEKEDKFLWYLTECFAASRKGGKVIVKKIRPHPIIQVGAISSFITSRNRFASGDLGLPLGLWLFACQAHIDVKRVLCRFGYSPGAFHAADHIARVIKQERQNMTVETIYSSIDWEHVDNVTDLHFVRVLVNFSPHLNPLSSQISARFRTTLAKHRLEPRKKRLQPLSTNAEQQMENKGYQAGFRNFDISREFTLCTVDSAAKFQQDCLRLRSAVRRSINRGSSIPEGSGGAGNLSFILLRAAQREQGRRRLAEMQSRVEVSSGGFL
ncbi:hypothetical protein DFH09DRAFT_1412993, partial [Mycena vulgaris]